MEDSELFPVGIVKLLGALFVYLIVGWVWRKIHKYIRERYLRWALIKCLIELYSIKLSSRINLLVHKFKLRMSPNDSPICDIP